MSQRTTTAAGVQVLSGPAEQKLAAIAAIAGGRLTEAHRLILDLLANADDLGCAERAEAGERASR